ncbi:MAG: hypothetical protein HC804_07300 [Anaerolineae bacterium]|nr:hypothetical protein [Anaerolineae bacterium]
MHKPYNGLELRARVRSMLRIKERHDELETALQLRQDLSSMIVHDIRSPLSAILISCDLLEMAVGGDSSPLSTIRSEATRLSGFLTDMLMMAKMEHGRLLLTRTAVNMNELLMAVRDGFVPMAGLKDISLVLEMPENICKLSVDDSLWRRVLDNLLTNAIKFSPTGGKITLRLVYPEQEPHDGSTTAVQMRLQVIDEGPGIPEDHRETVFDKFKIVASKRRDVSQVGLGLAFCKMVVDAHDGRIFVEPNEPRGSVFIIEL